MERILSFADALAEVLQHAGQIPFPASLERVDLLAAQGRVLAEPLVAERDQPPFPRSTRDGFAVRSTDLVQGALLDVVGLVRAGEHWAGDPLGPNQALEIMTGAPVPSSADAVLMVEHADLAGPAQLRPHAGRRLAPGENIVPTGAEATQGTVLVPVGRLIGTPEISLAASCGYGQLQVTCRPTVAIVATGDELVSLDTQPAAWQIRNSNTWSLASLTAAEGARALSLPVARDTRDDLQARLAETRGVDLLLLSGGVSMGKFDLVEDALLEAGAEFFFTGARIQPGKPVVFGRLPRAASALALPGGLRLQEQAPWTYFFGLPGNPLSTEVCFRLFVAPLLRRLCGRTDCAPRFAEARLAEEVRGGARVDRFLPASLQSDWRAVQVRPIPWQGSGDLAANGRADGFMVLPAEVPAFPAGATVRVLLR